MNLLIVDDEVLAVQGMMQGIDWKQSGIDGEVHVAHDAGHAYGIIESQAIDVVLCDIEMPGENGIELIRRVKSEYPDIACVFLTCHAKFEFVQEALRLGCEDYILSPAPYEAIAAVISRVAAELLQSRENRELAKYGRGWLHERDRDAENAQGDRRSAEEIAEDTARYILSNLSSGKLSVKSLAERSFINEDYLNRIFKREKGVSINSFIIRERMALAARLLKNPALSVASVAAETGYVNYPYFVTVFKRHYGCTPTQYRQRKT